jgi:hypothetical protein
VPQYTVKSPLKFNHKRYDINKSVTMDAEDAAPLVEQGVLEDPSAKKAKAEDKK